MSEITITLPEARVARFAHEVLFDLMNVSSELESDACSARGGSERESVSAARRAFGLRRIVDHLDHLHRVARLHRQVQAHTAGPLELMADQGVIRSNVIGAVLESSKLVHEVAEKIHDDGTPTRMALDEVGYWLELLDEVNVVEPASSES